MAITTRILYVCDYFQVRPYFICVSEVNLIEALYRSEKRQCIPVELLSQINFRLPLSSKKTGFRIQDSLD